MAIKLPERNYFKFSELMTRWQCNADDIRYLIINRTLRPSYFVDENVKSEKLVRHESGGVEKVPIDYESIYPPRGLFYLHFLGQRSAFDCTFSAVSPSRQRPDFVAEFEDFYVLDEELPLEQVLEYGVVTMEELAIVERELSGHSENQQPPEKLSSRERTTFLNTIAVMLELLQNPRPGRDSSAAIIREMVDNYSDKPGIAISSLEKRFSEAAKSLNAL
jgi:hypothetical protein